MKFTATNRKLRQLLSAFNSSLMPRPEFQRRLVWTNKDKLAFIDTVLRGYPFPEIYIASGDVDTTTGEGKELLVDGQQRLTTLFQYFKASTEIVIPKDFPAYTQLSEEMKKDFLEYIVVVRDLGPLHIHEVKDIFQRINSTSYSLNAMEMRNARYDGALKHFVQHIAGLPFFSQHKIFSPTNIRRMQDVVFTLTIVITMLSTYFHRDTELEAYLAKYNEGFPLESEIRERLTKVFAIIEDCQFGTNCRAWKKADIFSLICELDRALHKRYIDLDVNELCQRLNYFFNQTDSVQLTKQPVTAIEFYYKASIQATNDRTNRIARGEILQEVIDTEYKSDFISTDDSHIPDFNKMKLQMREWFAERFEDPAENCPYESAEGGYIYIWGGPFDARDVLFDAFSGEYPDEVIEELATELEQESWEWSAKPSDAFDADGDEADEDI